jgi:hypothetical protein
MTCLCLQGHCRSRHRPWLVLLLGAPVLALGLAWWSVMPAAESGPGPTEAASAGLPLQTLVFLHRGDAVLAEVGQP